MELNEQVNAVIFDLGGVLLNIDYDLTAKAFKKLGVDPFDQLFSQASQDALFDEFEKGLITEDVFFKALQHYAGNDISVDEMKKAWNAMLLDFPAENLNLLRSAGNKYRIFLLSNTNITHLRAFQNIMLEQHGIDNFDSYFEYAYYSHQSGMRKPEPEIFRFVISKNRLTPEKTLFIDDSEQHLHSAASTGLQTYQKTAAVPWEAVVDRNGHALFA